MKRELDLFRQPFQSPWSALERFFDEFPVAYSQNEKNGLFAPRCEVKETESAYFLRFDLPGMKKEEIHVDLNENRLTVSGERRSETKSEQDKVHFSEISYGSFTRSFTFPQPVDGEKVKAKFEDGILEVEVAKDSARVSRKISVS